VANRSGNIRADKSSRLFIAGHFGHLFGFWCTVDAGKIFFEYSRYYVYNTRNIRNTRDMQVLRAVNLIPIRLVWRIVYSIENIQLI